VRPLITFLTDSGPASAAVCQGVMLGICPEANILVISHQITRYSFAEGARTLLQRVGPPVSPERLVRLNKARPRIGDGVLETEITNMLLFGNVTLGGGAAELEAALGPLDSGQQLVIDR
jgi:S-adenosylmethionine hydrolase